MEEIKLIIEEDRFITVNNPFGEHSYDYICNNTFIFEKGKIYGLICEHGGGGDSISLLLTNTEPLEQEKVYIDGVEAGAEDIEKLGWYVGKVLYFPGFLKRKKSVRQAMTEAIRKYHRYERIEDIVQEFDLRLGRLDYDLSVNCEWDKWRASMAIGYASEKLVYCFPWMDTLTFFDCMMNSGVYLWFKKLVSQGAIIILPTSREENVNGITDHIIKIHSPRFQLEISKSEQYKKFF